MTSAPLFMFALAVRRISLSMVGFLQYISPTLQFLCGVVLYREPFTASRFVGFGFVWIALVIFAVEGFLVYRTQAASLVAATNYRASIPDERNDGL